MRESGNILAIKRRCNPRVSPIVLRRLACENRAHAAQLLRSQFSCDSTFLRNLTPSWQLALAPYASRAGRGVRHPVLLVGCARPERFYSEIVEFGKEGS